MIFDSITQWNCIPQFMQAFDQAGYTIENSILTCKWSWKQLEVAVENNITIYGSNTSHDQTCVVFIGVIMSTLKTKI